MVARSDANVQPPAARGQGEIDRILETIVYLYTESRRVTKQLARQHGLTGPQVTALKILEGFGALSLSELSARMSAKNSTITGIVDRMERDGLVARKRSETDRRVVHIEPTERGATIAAQIPVTAMEMFSAALSSLSKHDRTELLRILGALAERVRDQIERQEETLADEGG